MRKSPIVALLSLALAAAAYGESYTGVLINNHCGAKIASEKSAAAHPRACNLKEDCVKSGFQIVVGDKHMKLDAKGNELAKKYLADEDHPTHVVVEAAAGADGTLAVTSIKEAAEKEADDDDQPKPDKKEEPRKDEPKKTEK